MNPSQDLCQSLPTTYIARVYEFQNLIRVYAIRRPMVDWTAHSDMVRRSGNPLSSVDPRCCRTA